jgi:hypothetical protein
MRIVAFVLIALSFSACSVIEKTSKHEFESGYYNLKNGDSDPVKVFLEISEDTINVYSTQAQPSEEKKMMVFPMVPVDSSIRYFTQFSRQSLDIDVTTILFKFRPEAEGQPAQMTTDFNFALYAGWRHDNYKFVSELDPLGRRHYEVVKRGFDVGILAGAGTTFIGPFNTRDRYLGEYNGLILQYGLAFFLESNVASFGIACGFDHLMSEHRNVWIYDQKPWLGFVIGIALH